MAEALPAKHPQKVVAASYKKAYETKYKEDVSTFGGHAYDPLMILAKAIGEKGLNRGNVRTAIENMKGFAGTAGIFNFSPTDHNGLDIGAFEMLTVRRGKFAPLKK